MKKIIEISLFMLIPILGFSQNGGIRFTEKFGPFASGYQYGNDFSERKLIPYHFIREADVMWSKVTWEIIDLREKSNLFLYYPTEAINGRKSLINVIMEGLKNDLFNAYEITSIKHSAFPFSDENLIKNDPIKNLTKMQIIENINSHDEISRIQIAQDEYRDSLLVVKWKPAGIVQILVQKVWYFDRKDSKLYNEIIGICPIWETVDNGDLRDYRLFWIYYPDCRDYFSKVPVYNLYNNADLYSFDDLFVNRKYNSYFVGEDNVYNDRMITDYVTDREAQLESERIKKEIFDYEQDLWEN
jgi:gliding motility associated protien GldN